MRKRANHSKCEIFSEPAENLSGKHPALYETAQLQAPEKS
jgi:hypothetical protein